MISFTNNFLFIHVPKTAGNSIQSALDNYSDDEIVRPLKNKERFGVKYKGTKLIKHSSLKDYYDEFGFKKIDGLFKFVTIRNPWDRAMSFYFSPHRGQVEWDKSSFINFVSTQIQPLRHYIGLSDDDDLGNNIDRFIKFESINSDFGEIALHLNLDDIQLPHINKSNKKPYTHYYDKELIELIEYKFAEEISLGKYLYK